ncbi:CehA/McbA family metallohydrolase [Frigidibacter sp. MR17.24]|uniref:CehA/McbA family metallohydrolase n=1 Tax=Frigidibacter sp. MR17.24 TaxID=3127345 RepID=UPI003012D1B7
MDPFTAPGLWLRGNLHCHSDRSDGALPPAEVCARYAAAGYDFIALTDHFVGRFGYPVTDTAGQRGNGFTTLLGAELHSGAMANGELWHLLAVGLPADFAPSLSPDFQPVPGQESAAALAARARAAGAFVAIAHPHWSGLSEADAAAVTAAHAVEVYNHGCAVDCDRGEGFVCAEALLNAGRRVTLVATDDAHFHTPDHFGGWVMVKAPEATPEAILAALRQGAFYASQGPEIRALAIEDGAVVLESSPAAVVILAGQGVATESLRAEGGTAWRLPIGRLAASPWLRVTVVDADGRRAWSNPLWR